MRRALRAFALAALALTATAAVLGLQVWRRKQEVLDALAAGEATDPSSILEAVHAAAGHAGALVTGVVAAMAFLLGLHGLLESGGRRARALVLFVLGPAVMGVALWAELTGLRRGRDEIAATIAGPDVEPLLRAHALPGVALVAGALVAVAAAFLLARPDPPESESDDG